MAPTGAVPCLLSIVCALVENADYSSDFSQNQRSDRFYKFCKLTCTNTTYHTSSGTWHRGKLGFLGSAKQEDINSSPAFDHNLFVQVISAL